MTTSLSRRRLSLEISLPGDVNSPHLNARSGDGKDQPREEKSVRETGAQ